MDVRHRAAQRAFDRHHHFTSRGFFAFLCLDADHRHVLVVFKGRVKNLGDSHIAQPQRRNCVPVEANIHRLRAFRPDRSTSPEVDAKVQALDHEAGKGQDHQKPGKPQP